MFKFKINNRSWIIEERSQSEIKKIQNTKKANQEENIYSTDVRYFGVTWFDEQTIYLDESLPAETKRAALIHELTHCYIGNYITHCDKQYTEEDVADIVSNSYDIIAEIIDKYFKKE